MLFLLALKRGRSSLSYLSLQMKQATLRTTGTFWRRRYQGLRRRQIYIFSWSQWWEGSQKGWYWKESNRYGIHTQNLCDFILWLKTFLNFMTSNAVLSCRILTIYRVGYLKLGESSLCRLRGLHHFFFRGDQPLIDADAAGTIAVAVEVRVVLDADWL